MSDDFGIEVNTDGASAHTDKATEILQAVYGYPEFRGDQKAIIDTVVDGQSALVLMPTGGGKSLCYQIPALARDGVGVVVSPLIALMQDQVDALRALGINAAFINSTMDALQIQQTESDLLAGTIDLLYVAPERLLMPQMLSLLDDAQLSLFAIDEAHCVSQWGHDFRQEYLGLSVLENRYPSVPRIALTATADSRTRKEIAQQLQLTQAALFVSSFDRPNIRYHLEEGGGRREVLYKFLERQHPEDSGIIYCLSRKKVDETAQWLSSKGRTALPYHAGLSASSREDHQRRFLCEDNIIIVATIAFGMGIDKPDVRFVAHLNLPKSMEAYYQETGRAGRDGEPANAWMSYGLQDIINLRHMLQQSDAAEVHKRQEHSKLEAMMAFAEQAGCRRHSMLAYFDEVSPQSCGNCDNCLHPPEVWDGTEAAQKALSCVYRTGQRFGVNYVIDVLRGISNERIERAGHQHVSTFGVGENLKTPQWKNVFRQLIANGMLYADVESHGVIRLTEKSRPVLRGEVQLWLRESRMPEPAAARKSRTGKAGADIQHGDQALWDALRTCRKRLADEQGVPAYVIFSNATLVDMLEQHPRNLQQMLAVSGVGDAKLQKYGAEFLDVLEGFSERLTVAEDY